MRSGPSWGKKDKHCDPSKPGDQEQGSYWDHVLIDAVVCFRRDLIQRMGEEGDPGRSSALKGSCSCHWGVNQPEQQKPPSAHPLRLKTLRCLGRGQK